MDKEYTSSKTEVIPATGHTLTAVAEVPATCETAGTSAHWKCDVCGKLFSDAEGNTETTLEKLTIPATGHAYGAPVWKWNDDFTASATFTCGNDDSHVEKVDATVTSEVTEGSCEVGGTRTYTAKVTFEGKEYTDTKTEASPRQGPHPDRCGRGACHLRDRRCEGPLGLLRLRQAVQRCRGQDRDDAGEAGYPRHRPCLWRPRCGSGTMISPLLPPLLAAMIPPM